MSETPDQEDRTEEASERRIDQALERGDVPRSADLSGFMALAAGVLALMVTLGAQGRSLADGLAAMLAQAHVSGPGASVASASATIALTAMAGPMLASVVAAIAAGMILHRPQIATEPLMPKLSRISPGASLKRLIGKDNLVHFGRSLAKLSMVCATLGIVLWGARDEIAAMIRLEPLSAASRTAAIAVRVAVPILLLYAAVALFDAVYQYFAWKKRLRMSQQEVKQETKETDGNPEIKARLRALRQARSRQRIIAAVPKAAVVLVNPTHFAVALAYDKGMQAPVCVAKGVDELALKIREVAREHRIPIVSNPPLARALHATVDIDESIPAEHYKAVAEVIGFVLRARKRR